MGKITEALKKVRDDRIARIQKKPDIEFVVRNVENSKIDQHIVSFHDPTSPIAEQYKIVRTNIQTQRATKNVKTFIITSSIHNEGKTVTGINLAMSMAHDLNDKSVLLIDADMRKGKVARYLGLNHHAGLSEVLSGKANLDSAFISPNVDNFTVLLAGRVPKNPAELLGSRKMQSLIASCRNRFDYVFIDTPPIMPLTDACTLGPMVDGAILIIQAGRTQRGIVKQARNRLYQARTKTLGYIMTNVEYHLPQYLYKYIQEYGTYKYKYHGDETVN